MKCNSAENSNDLAQQIGRYGVSFDKREVFIFFWENENAFPDNEYISRQNLIQNVYTTLVFRYNIQTSWPSTDTGRLFKFELSHAPTMA